MGKDIISFNVTRLMKFCEVLTKFGRAKCNEWTIKWLLYSGER